MITIFNREKIYTGTDMQQFSSIQRILDLNKIRYDYRIERRSGAYLQSFGSLHTYEIFVRKKDYDEAMFLICEKERRPE